MTGIPFTDENEMKNHLEYLGTIDYIRHPSHGGKTECVIGILSI